MTRLHSLLLLVCVGLLVGADAAPESQPLQGIFMEVQGKVRWRASERDAWRDAAVNDLFGSGAEVRTGLRSRATLRLGQNASVLVDSGTSFQVPTVVREGESLRTMAAVKTGRVDFKVDRIEGFANDFKVVTPQTTLAVRGTGFAVNSGVLNGVEITGARTNMINAIEIRYVAGNLQYFLSGDGKSTSSEKDPVKNAWMNTLGPPQVVGTIVDGSQLEQAVAQGNVGNAPTNPQQWQQIAAAETNASVVTESPLDGLLEMQRQAAAEVDAQASQVELKASPALAASLQAIQAGGTRETAINDLLTLRDDLEDAWEGEAGSQQELAAMVQQGAADQSEMTSLRQDLEDALTSEEDGPEADAAAFQAMDAIHAIDDEWQETIVGRARDIVTAVRDLHDDMTSGFDAAEAADQQFSALLSQADSGLAQTQATAQSLASLQGAVLAYRKEVQRLVASGRAGAGAAAALIRSSELLAEASNRVAQAVQKMQSVEQALASANSVGERVLFSAALAALSRGDQIRGLADGQLIAIEGAATAIEAARFSAFFAAAAAAFTVVPEVRQDAIDASQATQNGELELQPLADAAEAPAALVRQLADELDTFWNQPDFGSETSRKVRMENLRDQSAADLLAMENLLTQLGAAIGASDLGTATTHLASMQTINAGWQADGGELLAEARVIDGDVQLLNAGVQDAFTAFEAGEGGAFAAKLAQVESARNSALSASQRLQAMKLKLDAYVARYQEITGDGRGQAHLSGLGAALSNIAAIQDEIADSVAASDAAVEAAQRATTYGAKVFYAATSQRVLDSAGIAAASAALLQQIEQNAAGIQATFGQGQTNYDAAFGGQGGGGR